MSDSYGSHVDYMKRIKEVADARQRAIETALHEAFAPFIKRVEVEVIAFSGMSALDLAKAILSRPLILKPLLACCNVAGRAIERDLEIRNLSTYVPRLSETHATAIAGYLKPFLPPVLEIPAIIHLDKTSFIDKELRKSKGQWEQGILRALNRFGAGQFKKRKFIVEGESFELDAASPTSGDIRIGMDVKRIEARRDIHKRCDEIVNKARKLKVAFPESKFGAVMYYPFITEHTNIQNRLHSADIGGVVFASESDESIETAVGLLLATLEVKAE